jgi:hypothetical protein
MIIKYRTVINDAAVWPWEDMPEVQPATLTGLINYLRQTCGINPEPLEPDAWRSEGYAVRYGYHKQFWLPVYPTDAELELMVSWHKEPEAPQCPVCNTDMSFTRVITAGITEENHALSCNKCRITITQLGDLSYTAKHMVDTLDAAYKRVRTQAANSPIPGFCLGEEYSGQIYAFCKQLEKEVGLKNGATALYWSLQPTFEAHMKRKS